VSRNGTKESEEEAEVEGVMTVIEQTGIFGISCF